VSRSIIQQNYLIYGLTPRIDVEIAPQWLDNQTEGASVAGFGDFPAALGYQLLEAPHDSLIPDVRVWVQELFPTGRYQGLPASSVGLGGTGGGAFATTLGIAAQKVLWLGSHAFRYRLNVTYGFYSAVAVHGFNTYGGGFGTDGRVRPGAITTVALAGEYAVTRHVVLAVDVGFQSVNPTHFSGTPGVSLGGKPATVGRGYSNVLTVAPAVEYHWNEHVAVIAGPWMSLRGRNASEFFGLVAALYMYF
jgi:hypothetical protein